MGCDYHAYRVGVNETNIEDERDEVIVEDNRLQIEINCDIDRTSEKG